MLLRPRAARPHPERRPGQLRSLHPLTFPGRRGTQGRGMLFMEPTFDMPERQLSRRCEKCNNQKLVSDLGAQKAADATPPRFKGSLRSGRIS